MKEIIKVAVKKGEVLSLADFEKRLNDIVDVIRELEVEELPVVEGYSDTVLIDKAATPIFPDGEEELMYYEITAITTDKTVDGNVVCYPTFVRESLDVARHYFGLVFVGGVPYLVSDSRIVIASDTGAWILKDKGYKILPGNRYVEKVENLVFLPRHNGYTTKANAVVTEDLGEFDMKELCYLHDGKYYSFEYLIPGYEVRKGNPIRFDATPKSFEIKGRMIGVEFEMEDTENLGLEVLKSKRLREHWRAERDGSLSSRGTEFVSVPLNINNFDDELETFMAKALEMKATVNDGCGFHVHVSASDLNHKDIVELVRFAKNNEKDFFSLVARSRQNNNFCKKINDRFNGFSEGEDQHKAAIRYYGSEGVYRDRHRQTKWAANSERHFWLNLDRLFLFRNDPSKITVEFRPHEASTNLYNFINFVKLCWWTVEYTKNAGGSKGNLKDVANYSKDKELINYLEKKFKPSVSDFLSPTDNVIISEQTIIVLNGVLN